MVLDVLEKNYRTTHSLLLSFPCSFSSFSAYISATWYNGIPWCISCPGRPLPPQFPVVVHPDPFLDSILDGRDRSAIKFSTNSSNIPQSFVNMLHFISRQLEVSQGIDVRYFQIQDDLLILGLLLSNICAACLHWKIFPALWRFFLSCAEGWLNFNITSWHKTRRNVGVPVCPRSLLPKWSKWIWDHFWETSNIPTARQAKWRNSNSKSLCMRALQLLCCLE